MTCKGLVKIEKSSAVTPPSTHASVLSDVKVYKSSRTLLLLSAYDIQIGIQSSQKEVCQLLPSSLGLQRRVGALPIAKVSMTMIMSRGPCFSTLGIIIIIDLHNHT
jgi:hypothetical protein